MYNGRKVQVLEFVSQGLNIGKWSTGKHCDGIAVVKNVKTIMCIRVGGELYESVGVEAPILLSYTHKNEWNTHDGPPTRCQRSAMGASLIFVGVRQQNGCFDTHTFIQFSTYEFMCQEGGTLPLNFRF